MLVRDVGLPGWLRVTAGTPAETDAFLAAHGGQRAGWRRTRDRASSSATPPRPRSGSSSTVDGTGRADIATGIGFYDHMLAQLARHGGFDLTVRTDGDLHIDAHHTVEDTALALGAALAEALGDKAGVRRFGDALVPLDEVLVQAAVDLSGRPYVVHEEPPPGAVRRRHRSVFPTSLTRHVWESFGHAARITLHVTVLRAARPGAQPDAHHVDRGPVQGGRPGAARRRRGSSDAGRRRAQHQGRALR